MIVGPLEHQLLNEAVSDNLDQPLVVAGDFNAVDDHGPMQACDASA